MTRLGDDVAGGFAVGQTSVGTTAVTLVGTPTKATRGVQLKAATGNTADVYVGPDSSVTSTTGFALAAGEGLLVKIDDAVKVYLISTAEGQSVEYMVV